MDMALHNQSKLSKKSQNNNNLQQYPTTAITLHEESKYVDSKYGSNKPRKSKRQQNQNHLHLPPLNDSFSELYKTYKYTEGQQDSRFEMSRDLEEVYRTRPAVKQKYNKPVFWEESFPIIKREGAEARSDVRLTDRREIFNNINLS